jgi:hypothetical protein
MCYKNKHIINLIDQEKILFLNDNLKLNNLHYVKFLIKNDLYTDFLWLYNNLINKIDIQLYFFVKNNFNNKNNKTADFIINNFKY